MKNIFKKASDITFENIIGKVLLVGITEMKGDKVVEQRQYHGTIVYACEDNSICIKQDDGSIYSIPPLLSNITVAKPGEYRERATGKIIENPDLISSWISDLLDE